MRPLGIDLGSKRIGVAIADSAGLLATPYDTVLRSGDKARDHRRIAELAAEVEADQLVVGLPLSLDGSVGRAAKAALKEADQLARVTGLPVDTWDERLTTVTAHRDLMAADLDAKQRRRGRRQGRSGHHAPGLARPAPRPVRLPNPHRGTLPPMSYFDDDEDDGWPVRGSDPQPGPGGPGSGPVLGRALRVSRSIGPSGGGSTAACLLARGAGRRRGSPLGAGPAGCRRDFAARAGVVWSVGAEADRSGITG